MLKKIVPILLVLLLALSAVLVACAKPAPAPAPKPAPAPAPAAKQSYKWKFSVHRTPEDVMTLSAKEFAKKVGDRSGGRMVIDVFDSNALGDWIPVFEEVMKGTIEFQNTSYSTVHDPRLDIVWIPYLVKSWAEVKKAYTPGGWVFDTAAKMNRELGVEVIAALPEGFIGMGAKKMPPSPGDPNVAKNMKIRVWGAIPPEKLMTRLGYLPTVMPWAEVFTALQTGVVEAVYGGSVNATYDTVRDVIKFWLPYRGNFENMINIMNLKLLNSLSAEDKKIVLDASKEASDAQTAKAEDVEKQFTQKMKDYGIQVYEFSDAEYKAMAEATAKDVWPKMQPLIGKALLDEALAYFKTL